MIEAFGAALHGTEDFYSHSNWVDQASGTFSVTNPPGLGINGISGLTDLTAGANFVALDNIPNALTTGCFSVEEKLDAFDYTNDLNQCYARVTPTTT